MIGPAEQARLEAFLDEAYRWNQRINLTSVPRAQAWERHVAEPLRALETLQMPAGATVVDIGSGLGVPGLPLALLRPDLRITLLEASARRAGFLTHAAGILGLGTVRVVAQRAERAGHDPQLRESFDIAISRATASPPVLCELALPLLRVGGRLLALVAGPPRESASEFPDWSQAAAASRRCGGGPPSSPHPGLLAIDKLVPSPDWCPRRAGQPARHPLVDQRLSGAASAGSRPRRPPARPTA